jgi:hypothetical protein
MVKLASSCNGNKAKNSQNQFKVLIDLIAYQDGDVQLFYKLNTDDRYWEKYSQKQSVKQNDLLQTLAFELPKGIRPKNLRIDLGERENDSIRVENIRLRYKNLELNGNHGVYKSWFAFNQNMVVGKDSLTFHLKKVAGFFDPQLNGNQLLNSKLVKLFPPDVNEF